MPTVEAMKLKILAIDVEEAKVVRFLHATQQTVGLILEATQDGYTAWAAAVESLGCRPEIHNGQRLRSGGFPPSYLFDVVVYI